MVPDHVLQLFVDILGVTEFINQAFAGAVIELKLVIGRTLLLDAQAFSGDDIPSRELIVAVLQFPPARTILRLSFHPPVELARQTGIFAGCQKAISDSYQVLRTDLVQC